MLVLVENKARDDLQLSTTLFVLLDYLDCHWESEQSDSSSRKIWLDEAYVLLNKKEGISCVIPNS